MKLIDTGFSMLANLGGFRKRLFQSLPRDEVIFAQEASDIIGRRIMLKTPTLVTRFGTSENNTILNFLETNLHHSKKIIDRLYAKVNGLRTEWDPNVIKLLCNNAGVFPNDIKIMEKYAHASLDLLPEIDLLIFWGYVLGESYLRNKYAPNANLINQKALEPYLLKKPWSRFLKGLKVLVVHPFADTIQKQYLKREEIFNNPDILPEFDLKTIRAVQSLGGNHSGFENWFVALDSMKNNIRNTEFDVCIIGAGAYGMHLSAYVKKLGKIAIHMGGSTQLLFGIKGDRWDKYVPEVSKLYNSSWVRPSDDEKPLIYSAIENGCYW